MARVNVIIANKDYTQYLYHAIKSCHDQTIKVNFTVIDDGSTNRPLVTSDFEYEHLDTRQYKLYKNKNGDRFIFLDSSVGPSLARNIAMSEAFNDTDYFMILDADDMMLPKKVEKLLAAIEENPEEIGVAYGDYYIQDENGLMKMEFKRPFSRDRLERECIVHSGALINKKALILTHENNHFYDPQMRVAEDYDLWMRISEHMMIKHVPEFLSIVRNHKRNSSNTVDQGVWNQCLNRLHQKRLQRTQE
jgi:glycosyltransferase involved in cell wall biosynthesis